jgi:hypothetical protein
MAQLPVSYEQEVPAVPSLITIGAQLNDFVHSFLFQQMSTKVHV